MAVTETGSRARQPDTSGYATAFDGLRIYYEVFGHGATTIVFLPANPIAHSRLWRAQVHHLARHFRVVVYDGRGQGLSDFPDPAGVWPANARVDDCLAVMDATGTDSAYLVGICVDGVFPSACLAATNPDRVLGIVAIGTGLPLVTDRHHNRKEAIAVWDQVIENPQGWFKYNEHHLRNHYEDFLTFFFGEMFPEPHSTKQVEDAVAYGLDGNVDVLLMDEEVPAKTRQEVEAICRQVRCPVLIIQGDRDNCQPIERSQILAETTGGRYVLLEGSGHIPNARHPVRVNRLIAEFAGAKAPTARRRRKTPRALLVSSPIGLGHAWRDAGARGEARRRRIRPARAARLQHDPPHGRDPVRQLHGLPRRRISGALRRVDRRRGLGDRPLPPREPRAQNVSIRVVERLRRLPPHAVRRGARGVLDRGLQRRGARARRAAP
ncbi:MAG: alpha/beta hydrolase [Chloroflexi bacterium]|nr:MAG: alpha/beta hydrolase [Chloroflexota bacterium]